MDKSLANIRGITIERRVKNNPPPQDQKNDNIPSLPSGITVQRKSDNLGNITLPKGITIQPPKRPATTPNPLPNVKLNSEDWPQSNFEEDYGEYEEEEEEEVEDEYDNENEPNPMTQTNVAHGSKSSEFESSEEDADHEPQGSDILENFSATNRQFELKNLPISSLPPGIVLERKNPSPKPTPAPLPTAVPALPPGISFQRKSVDFGKQVHSPSGMHSPHSSGSPKRQVNANIRSETPPRPAVPISPQNRFPVRATQPVRPINVSDFMEQRMKIGTSPLKNAEVNVRPRVTGPQSTRFPRMQNMHGFQQLIQGLPLKSPTQQTTANKSLPLQGNSRLPMNLPLKPDFPRKTTAPPKLVKPQPAPKPALRLPAGITVQPRKADPIPKPVPKPVATIPNLPQGITLQKKSEKLEPIEEDVSETLLADLSSNAFASKAPPKAPASNSLRSVRPLKHTPKLPPGITLQPKAKPQIPTVEEFSEEEEESEEPFEGEHYRDDEDRELIPQSSGSGLNKSTTELESDEGNESSEDSDNAMKMQDSDMQNLFKMMAQGMSGEGVGEYKEEGAGQQDDENGEEGEEEEDETYDDEEMLENADDEEHEETSMSFPVNAGASKNLAPHPSEPPIKAMTMLPAGISIQPRRTDNDRHEESTMNFSSNAVSSRNVTSQQPEPPPKAMPILPPGISIQPRRTDANIPSPQPPAMQQGLNIPPGITLQKKTENLPPEDIKEVVPSVDPRGEVSDIREMQDEPSAEMQNLLDMMEKGDDEDGEDYKEEDEHENEGENGKLDEVVNPNDKKMDECDENEDDDLDEEMRAKMQDAEKDEMQNLVDMMTKGEIEGEIEDYKEEGSPEKESEKRKLDEATSPASKKMKSSEFEEEEEDEEDEEDEEGEGEGIDKSKVTGSHLRKNIREVMDETKLDEATIAAQRQEAERLQRLQEQQRIIREVQRQMQHSKQSEKVQSKVLSLLQGNSQTSILKTSSISPNSTPTPSRAQNSILLKMSNGQLTSLNDKMLEMLKGPGKSQAVQPNTTNLLKQGMVSSSVTIAAIKKEPLDDKKKKVVTLSSDSDDDCIVLSDEEVESEPEDDPTNSGMHTVDKYNVPDAQGRVLVNTGHPPEEQDIFLAPQIARIIKPHQVGGIRFLFDNIIESVDRYKMSSGFGCILAHSMGLGKTLQIVSFSDIFLRHTTGKKILVIMPINTIQNWLSEFNMWVPKETNSEGDVRCRDFEVYVVNESLKNMQNRGRVILEWHKNGGVLLIGYELFRLLSLRKPIKSKRKRPDEIEDERNRELVKDVYRAIVDPGPDLVICDEGHRIKNSHATTSQALKQIKTRRRVVLTGYPLQNNLIEYWCMVDFVRPNYLGSKQEFSNMFERPIQNGQCIDSTPQDKRLMRYRAHVLHSLLEGFVQRRSHAVLQQVLPKKDEFVLLLRFTPFQRKLYDTFMNEVVRIVHVPNPLKAFAVCCKIWNHPDVLYNFLKKGEQVDLDLEEAIAPAGAIAPSFDIPLPGTLGALTSPSQPWPKRGPGSRGGKVRGASKRKALNTMSQQIPPAVEKPAPAPPPEPVLPSMSQFAVQSSSKFGPLNTQDNSSGFDNSGYQQNNYYPQQQTPIQSPQRQMHSHQPTMQESMPSDQRMQQQLQHHLGSPSHMQQQMMPPQHQTSSFPNEDFAYQQGNSNASSSSYNTPTKMENQKMDQNMFDFEANFGGDPDLQGQQFQHPGNSSAQFSGNNNQQHYPNDQSVSSGFDYNQSTTDMASDFGPMSNFNDSTFDASGFGGSNQSDFNQQQYWGSSGHWSSGGGAYSGSSSDEFMSPPKFPGYDGERKDEPFGKQDFSDAFAMKGEEKKMFPPPNPLSTPTKADTEEKKEDPVKKDEVPYDWATELFKNYVSGIIENSSKMEVFFLILNESIKRHDRILVFSQSLLTLDMIEEYLQKRKVPGREENWGRNRNYFRLDGSTPALEREKLINEFNANSNVMAFLVSTRAGSLGINLVGANRVIVFDASWNPCHDTQAVCRVYRYGQQKRCYVYRLVMDCCLERKIYDRQINKQGMADRVVDELNPDAHLSLKEVTNLCWDDMEESSEQDFSDLKDKYGDDIIKTLVTKHSHTLSKAPFQHESLLVDRKEKKLSQAEKRLAKRSYELEKQQASQPRSLYQFLPTQGGRSLQKPIASVKPMQNERFGSMPQRSKWISAEVWQKQGMTAHEMTLPLDVVIPTNCPDKASIVLNAGQRVMVLKSPKGIYMQLESGKIIAIRTAFKVPAEKTDEKKGVDIANALKNNPSVTITPKSVSAARVGRPPAPRTTSSLDKKAAAVNMAATRGRIGATRGRTMPFNRKLQAVSIADKDRFLQALKPDETEKPQKAAVDPGSDNGDSLDLSHDQGQQKMPTPTSQAGSSRLPQSKTTNTEVKNVAQTWSDVPKQSQPGNMPESTAGTVVDDKKEIKTGPLADQSTAYPYGYPADTKEGGEVKKEEDPVRAWPPHPYGNYYPGYYGYGPMPGYEGYPYPPNYPPHPPVPVKQEMMDTSQATPSPPTGANSVPPAAPPNAAPPMYPPYNPYPYPPYNYAPFPPQPPQGQHFPPGAAAGTAPSTAQKPGESSGATENVPFAPSYNGPPRPPFAPTGPPPGPGYYPNYPPYRPPPYHPDPNFPYGGFNPFMPPAGYGYPMQHPTQGTPGMAPQQASNGAQGVESADASQT